jgi:hypothetical protein
MKLSSLGTSWRSCHSTNQGCACTTVCGHPFAYPHSCEISNLPNVASVAPTADLLKVVILQHPMQSTLFASIIAVVALGTSPLCNLESSLCYIVQLLCCIINVRCYTLLLYRFTVCHAYSWHVIMTNVTQTVPMSKCTLWLDVMLKHNHVQHKVQEYENSGW